MIKCDYCNKEILSDTNKYNIRYKTKEKINNKTVAHYQKRLKFCSDECKEKCMSMYDENGKFIGKEKHVHGPNCNHDNHQEIINMDVKKVKDANGKVKATVTLTKMVDGNEVTEEKVFEGDDLEVDAKIAELGK